MNLANRESSGRLGSILVAALWLLALGGCTDVRLKKQAEDTAESLDNQLRIQGRFCTEPSGDVSFPVKVLYILDQSASLQCTDSGQRRFGALRNSVNALRRQPNTEFAFIGFSSWSRQASFTRNRDDIAEFLDPNQGLGPATDYQGALATAVRLIEQDMLEVGPAERARTRYQVVFVSDGVPEPRCVAGCEDDRRRCADGEDNDGDGSTDGADPDCDNIDDNTIHPDNMYGVCNTSREIPEGVYVDMSGICPAYNQPPQIRRRIEELLTLKETYSAGGLVVHTVLLFSPQDVVEQVCPDAAASFGYEKQQAEALMREMARQGNGTFRDVNISADSDDFLQFDITSLKAEQTLSAMMASNVHARRRDGELVVDSDGDGLADALERELGADFYSVDTDGDGWSDLFEYVSRTSGFGVTDAAKPALACDDTDDRDGDGLRGCEERFIGTETLLPDSDGDDLLDWHELLHGTDPLFSDAEKDIDFDGVDNAGEIRGGTQPSVADEQVFRAERIVYGLDDRGLDEVARSGSDQTDERRCYDFDIRRIPLVVPPIPRQRGLNRILVHTAERPARVGGATGRTRVACFEAFYDGSQVKTPPSGVIDVSDEALDSATRRLSEAFEDVGACAFFDADEQPVDRGALEEMIEACMPPKIALGRRLHRRDELVETLQRNVGGDLAPRLPEHPYELFVPIQSFQADRDCYRLWEFDLLERFIDEMEQACSECPRPQQDETDP